jgi:segregation and condensation protein A
VSYRVKLELFEGPLDLLLHLVKKNEVDIADIPIAIITDQYLEYMAMLEELNLDVAGEFLVMAATLMYIKSRCLLPQPEEADDEEEGDPRAQLIERLREYQRFREAAFELGERQLLARDVFARPRDAADAEALGDGAEPEVEVRDVSLGVLLDAFRRVLQRSAAAPAHEVTREGLTLRDCIGPILERLRTTGETTFDALFPDGATRHRIIVTFLALLELMRHGVVHARQAAQFGEVRIVLAAPSIEIAVAAMEQGGLEAGPVPSEMQNAEDAGGM